MFDGPFKEAQTDKPIPLPDDDFGAWKVFLYWLHHDYLPNCLNIINTKFSHDSGFTDAMGTVLENLVKTWQFADKIGQLRLMNDSIDLLCRLLRNFWHDYEFTGRGQSRKISGYVIPAEFFLRLLYHTPCPSKLCQLLLDFIALHLTWGVHRHSDYRSCFEDSEFSYRLSAAIARLAKAGGCGRVAPNKNTFLGWEYHTSPVRSTRGKPH